ncbi:MAG: FAD-binding oxidoreductase [Thermomicrobiales bacterium]
MSQTTRARTVDGSLAALAPQAIEAFAQSLQGELLQPGDAGYDAARQVWNGMIDRRPALIARCMNVGDVVAAVNFGREQGLMISVRGGGHNVAGTAVCDDGLMVDLAPMKNIEVDPDTRTARAEPGVLWSEMDAATRAHGLATPGGIVGSTGIAGFTLGGGIGWLSFKHGYACDNLIAADVVTADGRLLRASADENADLFWAIRGGGGNFGIVTSFEYQLHPITEVLAGPVFYPASGAEEVLRFYREFTADLPDELAIEAGFMTNPDGDCLAALFVCYAGDLEEGERIIEPLRSFGAPLADMIGRMPYTQLQSMFDDFFPDGRQNYWKSSLIDELSDGVLDAIIESGRAMTSPYSMVFLQNPHGACQRVPGDAMAYYQRNAPYNMLILANWIDPADSDRHIGWARNLFRAVQSPDTDRVFLNFLSGDEEVGRVRSAYGENYDRLVEIKTMYDPDNLFRMNQNIRPMA